MNCFRKNYGQIVNHNNGEREREKKKPLFIRILHRTYTRYAPFLCLPSYFRTCTQWKFTFILKAHKQHHTIHLFQPTVYMHVSSISFYIEVLRKNFQPSERKFPFFSSTERFNRLRWIKVMWKSWQTLAWLWDWITLCLHTGYNIILCPTNIYSNTPNSPLPFIFSHNIYGFSLFHSVQLQLACIQFSFFSLSLYWLIL